MSATPGHPAPDPSLVEELAKQALASVAPEELAVFDDTAQEYREDPDGVLAASGRDEAVGFGLDLALLTPYVLAMSGAVLSYLVSTVGKAAKQESEPLIDDWVHRLFRHGHHDPGHTPDKKSPDEKTPDEKRPADQEPEVQLSPAEMAEVREVALARAHDLKLPAEKARLLADAIVGGLNTAS